jgi:chemotaxis protein methyltransferase CheR
VADPTLEAVEAELVVEALYRRYGYDFRDYARASLRRRLRLLSVELGEDRISDLVPRILHEPALLEQVVSGISVPVSELFRDPEAFLALRQEALPLLRTYPQIAIWVAGCATGEEVYSLAILLHEENMLDICQIYATDMSAHSLAVAEEGIYSVRSISSAMENYQKAGGKATLTDYFLLRYSHGKFIDELKKNISFSQHNLATDGVFCETHLVSCRNVMIYFNRSLQGKVLELFRVSLVRGGFMLLGLKENVRGTACEKHFRMICPGAALFQKQRMLEETAESIQERDLRLAGEKNDVGR